MKWSIKRPITLTVAIWLIVGLIVIAAPTGASTTSMLQSKLLRVSAFPAGWSVDNSNPQSGDQGCLSGLKATPKHETKVRASFTNGNFPQFQEELATGSGGIEQFTKLRRTLDRCKSYPVTNNGVTAKVTVGAMSFPKMGQQSWAYSQRLTVQGVNLGAVLVLFRVGPIVGAVDYADFGSPDISQAETLIGKAVAK